MAFAAVDSTGEPRAWSVGPVKVQLLTYTCVSGDTTGTVTADNLSLITDIVVPGIQLTAAPTIAANVATLAFTDPAANRAGTIICFGK